MDTKGARVLGFDFQIVPIQQVEQYLPRRISKYGELVDSVIEKLQTLPAKQSLVFGQPHNKNSLDEKQCGSILSTLNSAFAKRKVNYSARYTKEKRMFIVLPYNRRKYKPRTGGSSAVSSGNESSK